MTTTELGWEDKDDAFVFRSASPINRYFTIGTDPRLTIALESLLKSNKHAQDSSPFPFPLVLLFPRSRDFHLGGLVMLRTR